MFAAHRFVGRSLLLAVVALVLADWSPAVGRARAQEVGSAAGPAHPASNRRSSIIDRRSSVDLRSAVDSVFAPYDRSDAPGCAVGVMVDGRLAYAHGYGMADLEHGLAITPASVFRVGSVSKQFTAAVVVLLAQDGVLSLDDRVQKWIPELPDYGPRFTIRRLLHHTSGVRDYLVLMELAGKRDDDYYTDDDVVAMLARQPTVRPAGHDAHPVLRRPHAHRPEPRDGVRARGDRRGNGGSQQPPRTDVHRRSSIVDPLAHQHDDAAHDRRRGHLHDGGGPGKMGPQLRRPGGGRAGVRV
ncbi:MAG: serine hydrolase, partial [Gemmatimonadota bacterium]